MQLNEAVKKVDPCKEVLKILQRSRTPLSFQKLCNDSGLDEKTVNICLKRLTNEGYDIKEIISGKRKEYQLVRYADVSQKDYYRILGKVKTPLLITADWHIGSVGFSELAFQKLLEDVDNFGIKDIIHAGDLLQGRGVHRLELSDLLVTEIDEQIELADYYISQFPGRCTMHVCIGNHESKLKGSIHAGLDALKRLAKENSKVRYYGHVFKLKLNKKFSILTMHTSGGLTYATSYRPQRIFDKLIERPDILVTGHLHKLMVLTHPPHHLILMAGTLQRENAYLVWKGEVSQVGWLILTDYDYEVQEVIVRTPRVF